MRLVGQHIQNFIHQSIIDAVESKTIRKTQIINTISYILVVALLVFGLNKIYQSHYLLAFAGFVSIICIALIVSYLHSTQNYVVASYALLVLLSVLCVFMLIKNNQQNLFFGLFYLIPLLSYLLLNLRRATFYCGFLFCLLSIFIFSPYGTSLGFSAYQKFWLLFSFFIVTVLSAAIEYIMGITFDTIEKQKNYLEQRVQERTAELEKAKDKAEMADHLKSAFLENLSYEIRNPLNAIVGFSNLLLGENIDKNLKKDMVNHIVSSSNILLGLVDDIIDVSNIESGKIEIHYQVVNVRNTVALIYNEFREKNTNPEISFKFNRDESEEITIFSDPNRISQILRHLLENAFKFTEKGEIEVGFTFENSKLVKFFVKDTGMGIPKSLSNKIFQRFATGDTNKHKFYRGSGLGLNICKSLVELMGGTIDYTSKINKGSTFYFTVASMPEKVKTIVNAIPDDLNWENKTILIAEDEECNYKYLKHLLNKTHATILWANNGQEAVDLASKQDIDLILMDIKMPVMNGLEATRAIKALNKNIPIIAQTAFVYENDENVSLRSGCDAYIAKPIGKNQLIDLMQRFIK